MNLKGRIPVEPLDDERLTRIERRIVAGAADAASVAPPLRAPRWGVALAATAMVVAIGAGFAGWQLRGGAPSTPTTIVTAEPVRVDTTGERALLDIGDARIESDPHTAFTVTRPDGGVLVTMTRGKVELSVDKRTGRAPLVVAAGDTRVIVVGTRFSVDYGDGTNGVEVRVTEGVVRVERHQHEVRVAAGQAWTTKRGVLALAELPEGRTTVAVAGEGATIDAEPDGAAAQIEIETDAPDVLRDRTGKVPDARIPTTGTHHAQATKPTGPEITRRQLAGGGSGASAPRSAALDLRKAVLAQPVLPPLDLGLRPEESISRYRQIVVEKTGDEASLAFYSIAVLQHQKLGRNGDALRTLDAYVRRFVGGREYKAALWLRVRILCLRGVDDRCRQAAYTYLHQANETPAAKVAEALTLSPR